MSKGRFSSKQCMPNDHQTAPEDIEMVSIPRHILEDLLKGPQLLEEALRHTQTALELIILTQREELEELVAAWCPDKSETLFTACLDDVCKNSCDVFLQPLDLVLKILNFTSVFLVLHAILVDYIRIPPFVDFALFALSQRSRIWNAFFLSQILNGNLLSSNFFDQRITMSNELFLCHVFQLLFWTRSIGRSDSCFFSLLLLI